MGPPIPAACGLVTVRADSGFLYAGIRKVFSLAEQLPSSTACTAVPDFFVLSFVAMITLATMTFIYSLYIAAHLVYVILGGLQ